jgi:hypothetical protein
MAFFKNKIIILFFFYFLDVHQFLQILRIAAKFLMKDIFGINIPKR